MKSVIDLHRFDLLIIKQKSSLQEINGRAHQLSTQLSDLSGLNIADSELVYPVLNWPEQPLKWNNNEFMLLDKKMSFLEKSNDVLQANRKPFVAMFVQLGFFLISQQMAAFSRSFRYSFLSRF